MLRALTSADFPAIHASFVESFSDYVIRVSPSPEQLREMLRRRGYVPELSFGIFEGDRVVAFTLNGVAGPDAYDSGTGVVPSHRRQGLARAMMDASRQSLRAAGYRRYILEVIEINEAAVALYATDGFVERRRLQCWSFSSTEGAEIEVIEPPDWDAVRVWWDIQPSWQNAPHALDRAGDRRLILGSPDAYVVLFPDSGDLAQLAVRPEARRKGAGRALLSAASHAAGKPLRILNIDAADPGVEAFLLRAGASRTVRQIEMVRELQGARPDRDGRARGAERRR